jgi:acyl-CoA synthetase (AMP-forming)/AMP-acid ligase II
MSATLAHCWRRSNDCSLGISFTANGRYPRISRQKVPQHIRFVDGFPMTGSGKVQKYVMCDRMAEELGRTAPWVAYSHSRRFTSCGPAE